MIQYHIHPFTLREIKIEVTYHCGLNCIHCSSDAHPSNSIEMARDDCLRILTEAADIGVKEVAFSGGEPFAWTGIIDAVEKAVGNHMKVTIYTTGNVVDFKYKSKRIHELGASRLIFSIFGGTDSTHEKVTRVAGSFKKTVDAIVQAKKIGLKTELHFVPMSNNYRELEVVAELGKRIGASVISVLRLVPQGRAALLHGRVLTKVQNLDMRRKIKELRELGFTIRTGSPFNFLMVRDCPECCAAIDRLLIGADLRLYPCDAFKQIRAEELVGTLRKSHLQTSSLKECWEESPYLEAIRKYLTTPFADPCRSCGLLETCLSGCLAQKVIASGTLDKLPDPDCLRIDFMRD